MADADDLLTAPAIEAGVNALAARNQHHLQDMDPSEREDAIGHWRELVLDVLTSARDAIALGPGGGGDPERFPGRAVLVFEDQADEGIHIAASFAPDIQFLENDEIMGTPAQVAALSMIERMQAEGEEEAGA